MLPKPPQMTQAQYAQRMLMRLYTHQHSGTTSVTTSPVYTGGTLSLITSSATPTAGWSSLYTDPLIDDDPQLGGGTITNVITIHDGTERTIKLPDGSVIEVAKDGSFTINDKDAKVTYRANRVRDFNSFVNASDKLEDFIRYCGALGVRKDEMLNMPVKYFIGWLIIEAAKADGENKPETDLLDGIHHHVKPHCLGCGRFISPKLIARRIAFCRPVCLEKQLAVT